MTLDRTLLVRVLCVGAVAAVMLPFGGDLFPYVSHQLDGTQFQALEAVLSTSLGFGIYSLIA